MPNSEEVHFKVYCVSGCNNDVKRFFVDVYSATNFLYMKEKLRVIFPNLRDSDFKITWKDADGDFISITNDEDFITALTEMSDAKSNSPIVLHVCEDNRNVEDSQRQFRVVCDVCQKGITGFRYKCIECPDYDLCANCESNGHHSEHMMLRLPNSNIPIAKLDRKMMSNAARALKKSAIHVAREAHRCARDSLKAEKGKKSEAELPNTSFHGVANCNECPFSVNDLGDMFAQNISPLVEMFAKSATNLRQQQTGQNPISDIVRDIAEAFTHATTATSTTQTPENSSKTASQNGDDDKNKADNSLAQTQPTAPIEIDNNDANANAASNQDMDWTIVNDSDESTSQKSAKPETPTNQAPPLPQDPRLMRGLAQLYEMGFSNENHFLNYMLESHNYNVGDVVKAILELK